ncbi:hypothetical protein IX307_002846 [Bacteroides pyogenes]|nr:hypothetical protein [Bacteroides pyogenes]MBR8793971.1 hypothetical protein [Bacteroides pyogenes]
MPGETTNILLGKRVGYGGTFCNNCCKIVSGITCIGIIPIVTSFKRNIIRTGGISFKQKAIITIQGNIAGTPDSLPIDKAT